MRIISLKALRDFWELHPEARQPLTHWHKIVSKTDFSSFQDIRNTFRSADWVEGKVIFDIGGNNYRLIAAVHFNTKIVYVREVLTHADYSKKG
ncbi:hypothetical protein ABS71_00475 [bacterium SCN 62-11]|nr:MAG: hypothetical protein ABS71_00475 [bacterium SCN 62-11]